MQPSVKKGNNDSYQVFSQQKKKGNATFLSDASFIPLFIILSGILSVLGTSFFGVSYLFQAFLIGIGVPLLIYSCANLHWGVYTVMFVSYFILGIMRWVWQIGGFPVGVSMDILVVLLLLSMLVHIGRNGSWAFANNPISIMILVWIGYNLAQVLNPTSVSTLAWMVTIRAIAGTLVFYYICLYAFKTYRTVDIFIQLWIGLSLLLALYGLVQEVHGFFDFETIWINSDPARVALYFNWGRWRRISFFVDPTTFGITAAYSSLLCLVLGMGPWKIAKRIYFLGCAGIMAISMVFSGTRTAYVLIPAGLAFLTILTLKRELIVTCSILFILGGGVILAPVESIGPLDAGSLKRLRSAFFPENDPSFQVRLKNQAKIKPFIQSHPIGAGLGSLGPIGLASGSPVGGFPPDSGLVKIAVELGYVGLFLYCILLFIIFKVGIDNYHKIRDPIYKNVQAAVLSVLFALVLGNYAQEAITMYPSSILFYASMAIVTVMPNFEKNES